MFESRYRFIPTAYAMQGGSLDACYSGLLGRAQGPVQRLSLLFFFPFFLYSTHNKRQT
jgi:hypothetical protein